MPLSSCREARFGRQAAPRLRCRRLSACWTRTDSACAGPSFSYACWRILLCPQIAAWDFSSFSFRCSPLFDRQCSPAGPSAEHRSPGPVRVQPFAQQAVACCSRVQRSVIHHCLYAPTATASDCPAYRSYWLEGPQGCRFRQQRAQLLAERIACPPAVQPHSVKTVASPGSDPNC